MRKIKQTVIYYQQKKNEINEHSISLINSLIEQLEKQKYVIKGVFVDQYNDRSEFYSLINTSLKNIRIIFISSPLDKFDQILLDEVARVSNLYIIYKPEIQ